MGVVIAELGNENGKPTFHNYVNQLQIDWVRFSFQVVTFPAVVALLDVSLVASDWVEGQRYRRGFFTVPCEGVLVAADSIPLGLSVDGERFTVDFSGNGLGVFFNKSSWASISNLFEWALAQPGAAVNRLDIAFDCFNGLLSIPNMDAMLRAGDRVNTRWRKASLVGSYEIGGQSTGETLYIGNRESGSFARVYDKRAQELSRAADDSSLPLSWIRLELELKDKRAFAVASKALGLGFHPCVFTGFLRACVDFLENVDSNKQRAQPVKWWKTFLNGVEKMPVKVPRPVASIERTQEWVNHSVAPSLALLMEHKGGDMKWLHAVLADGQNKITVEKRELLATVKQSS